MSEKVPCENCLILPRCLSIIKRDKRLVRFFAPWNDDQISVMGLSEQCELIKDYVEIEQESSEGRYSLKFNLGKIQNLEKFFDIDMEWS